MAFETRTEGAPGDEGLTDVNIYTIDSSGKYTYNGSSGPISSRDGYTHHTYTFTTSKYGTSSMLKIINTGKNGIFVTNVSVNKV